MRGGETRAAVLVAAHGWLGTPYRHQGSSRGVGCDCLGLVRGIWREVYGCEPERPGAYAPDWAESGGEERLLLAAERHCLAVAIGDALPGDLLVFRWRPHLMVKHLAILIEGERILHAYEGHAVTTSPLIAQWRRRIAGAFAFPERARD